MKRHSVLLLHSVAFFAILHALFHLLHRQIQNQNYSSNVFLGGSLIKHGGQNPLEAARYGCNILHGPNVSNFVEVYDYLKTLGITKEVKSSDDLYVSLVELLKEDKPINSENIKKIEDYSQNIFNNVIIELKKYI